MGLTIHYGLSTERTDLEAIRSLVGEVRQLALEIPFQSVEEIVEFHDETIGSDDKGDPHRWLKIQASRYLRDGDRYFNIHPLHVIAFATVPGEGSEPANFGLALYPEFVEMTTNNKKRRVPTKLAGWSWRSFCKTQYASDPAYGGAANFVRCHLSIVELLDAIQKRDLACVEVNDESEFWDHRDVRKLAEVVGEWNQLVAAAVGKFKDAAQGRKIEAPIAQFADFEHLEAKGQKQLRRRKE